MENSIKIVDETDIGYARQRLKNRVFTQLVTFFDEEAQKRGITKRDLALALQKDPGQLNRVLKHPSNLTLETISDLLVALDADLDTRVVRFSDKAPTNYMHPLLGTIKERSEIKMETKPPAPKPRQVTPSGASPSPKVELEIV